MFRVLSRILRVEPMKILKGVDLHGNKYYEIPPQRYFLFQREVSKLKRTVEPPNVDIFSAVEASKRVPTEWLAWLQWTRADPPEPGEVESNFAKKQAMKVKVGLLQEKHKTQSESSPKQEPAQEKLQQADVDEWKPH